MVTVSEQYKLEQENKRLKKRLLRHFELKDELSHIVSKRNLELKVIKKKWEQDKQKLEKIKELAKVFQREEWGDCRYIRNIICGKLNAILNSQEKE